MIGSFVSHQAFHSKKSSLFNNNSEKALLATPRKRNQQDANHKVKEWLQNQKNLPPLAPTSPESSQPFQGQEPSDNPSLFSLESVQTPRSYFKSPLPTPSPTNLSGHYFSPISTSAANSPSPSTPRSDLTRSPSASTLSSSDLTLSSSDLTRSPSDSTTSHFSRSSSITKGPSGKHKDSLIWTNDSGGSIGIIIPKDKQGEIELKDDENLQSYLKKVKDIEPSIHSLVSLTKLTRGADEIEHRQQLKAAGFPCEEKTRLASFTLTKTIKNLETGETVTLPYIMLNKYMEELRSDMSDKLARCQDGVTEYLMALKVLRNCQMDHRDLHSGNIKVYTYNKKLGMRIFDWGGGQYGDKFSPAMDIQYVFKPKLKLKNFFSDIRRFGVRGYFYNLYKQIQQKNSKLEKKCQRAVLAEFLSAFLPLKDAYESYEKGALRQIINKYLPKIQELDDKYKLEKLEKNKIDKEIEEMKKNKFPTWKNFLLRYRSNNESIFNEMSIEICAYIEELSKNIQTQTI